MGKRNGLKAVIDGINQFDEEALEFLKKYDSSFYTSILRFQDEYQQGKDLVFASLDPYFVIRGSVYKPVKVTDIYDELTFVEFKGHENTIVRSYEGLPKLNLFHLCNILKARGHMNIRLSFDKIKEQVYKGHYMGRHLKFIKTDDSHFEIKVLAHRGVPFDIDYSARTICGDIPIQTKLNIW
jgi:hypothetical protein